MRKLGFLKQIYCCYFSKNTGDRALYRSVVQNETRSILEIGISSISRSVQLLELAHRYQSEPVQYCGIDLFEAKNSNSRQVGYKMAHVELKRTGANIKLLPGDPFSCLSRSVNLLDKVDLLIVGVDYNEDSLDRSWFYLPRMLGPESTVLLEKEGPEGTRMFESRDFSYIEGLAEKSFSDYPKGNLPKAA
ncbi:hypothetical protein OAG56_06545 [Mariniblastus sp.]|nr:hypothetical protein [Mariniblastus sp.]MDB4671189.1 hypothetical protein [Pirellulaceae bacterium]MDB4757017.1 hypothetical protein [Mariniblastus sp.]